jgi:hypothetical protein
LKDKITVRLLDENNNPVKKPGSTKDYVIITGTDGSFNFVNLPLGKYKVKFDLPPTYYVTDKHIGTDKTVDSDIDVFEYTDIIELTNLEQSKENIDAGIYQKASLGNYI